jgi:hypothetical protein
MNRSDSPPRSSKTPPGRERALLRLMGTVILGLPSLGARLFPWDATEVEVAALVLRIDILAVSVVFVHWTALLTVAIGALVVVIMKGPAYFADSYAIDDSNAPGRARAVGPQPVTPELAR